MLEEALDHDPDCAEAHNLLGVLYESRGQNHAAYHAYRTALTIDPLFIPARQPRALLCSARARRPQHGDQPGRRVIESARQRQQASLPRRRLDGGSPGGGR